MRCFLLALLLVTGLFGSAEAQSLGSGGGYFFGETETITQVSATFTLPAVSGTNGATMFIWVGVDNNSSHGGSSCPGPSCLAQIGFVLIQGRGAGANGTYRPFWELYCSAGSLPCNAFQPNNTVIAAAGDRVKVVMTCTGNCTQDNASQTWTWSIQDVTQGWTWANTGAGGCNPCTWPMGLGQAVWAVELPVGGPAFSQVAWSNMVITDNGTTGPPNWGPPQAVPYGALNATYNKSGSSPWLWSWPSGLFGKLLDAFNVCYYQTASYYPGSCPAAAYSGALAAFGGG
jgi:hypothetical protein